LSTLDIFERKNLFSVDLEMKDVTIVLALAIRFILDYLAGPYDKLESKLESGRVVVHNAKSTISRSKVIQVLIRVKLSLSRTKMKKKKTKPTLDPPRRYLGDRQLRNWSFRDEVSMLA
jgi:hypothetical protein